MQTLTCGLIMRDPTRFQDFELVAYHANCTDGIAAAAVVLSATRAYQPEFVPVHYGQPLPQRILDGNNNPGGTILFVDFCPERDQIESIRKVWPDWFVIDHHKSREWLLKDFPEHAFYDLDRSGAMLTWHWFHEKPAPELLLYVQDRDLWQWKLDRSREVSAALNEEPKTLDVWEDLIHCDPRQFFDTGFVLLRARTRAAKALAEKAFLVNVEREVPFYAVNATENVSEVGEEILARFHEVEVACAFFVIGHHTAQLSFRSRAHNPGQFNALSMAKYFGGGGHEHAAGASLPLIKWARYLEVLGAPVPEKEPVETRQK